VESLELVVWIVAGLQHGDAYDGEAREHDRNRLEPPTCTARDGGVARTVVVTVSHADQSSARVDLRQ
jgi:hypothetical protein